MIMTMTKERQAQEYAENLPVTTASWGIHKRALVDAFMAGYIAAEQSMWRSVEEELPSNDYHVLVYVPSTEFRIGGYEVAYYDGEDWYTSDGEHIRPSHFMYIPSLPDFTPKTEKYGIRM